MTQKSSESGFSDSETVSKKSETTTEHEKVREKKERIRPPTKVVIRRLPPTMTKDEFINLISPVPEHDFLYFVRSDKSLGPYAFSRAYINFNKQEDIFTFKEQFDNYTFMDKKGNEYPAVVEFAPFQRLPKKRLIRKKDPKMKTLQQDPTYISFLESLEKKSADASVTQHCPLEYFPPPEKEKITTTPLLDFLRQRRAERQRMRDERREERRRKDQERKRLKDAERDRRRTPNKSDTDSVLKVLRNPDHEKDIKEDNRLGASKEKQQQQGISNKKREEERQRNNREKERSQPEIRRETRSQTSVKSYRDDRQKQMEMRAQRKMSDEQRKKSSFERNQVQNKTSDNRAIQENDKSQSSSKTSETRKSQELDKASLKQSETNRSQEFERHSSSKASDSRRGQDYERHSHTEYKKYYSGDQRKIGNDRYQVHGKENHIKDYDHRKTYKESDSKRSGYNKDVDQKKNYNNDQRRAGRNYSETENKKNTDENKDEQKVNKEDRKEIVKTEEENEGSKKWENMGAKPKKKSTSDNTYVEKSESPIEKLEKEDDTVSFQNYETLTENEAKDVESCSEDGQETVQKELKDTEEEEEEKKLIDEEKAKHGSDESKLNRTERSKSEEQNVTDFVKKTEHKHPAITSMRRGSLDSGDHEAEMQSNRMQRNTTGSDWSMEAKIKRNHSLEMEGHSWEQGDSKHAADEKAVGDGSKLEDKDKGGDNNGEGEQKRDPRAERRIRNKDRPSIEIYRPGMGRFSMQRKEREKSSSSTTGTTESSMEQESPSSSPSPTPVNSNRNKTCKSVTELRSMTFKRSVSREK